MYETRLLSMTFNGLCDVPPAIAYPDPGITLNVGLNLAEPGTGDNHLPMAGGEINRRLIWTGCRAIPAGNEKLQNSEERQT